MAYQSDPAGLGVSQRYGARDLGGVSAVQKDETGDITLKYEFSIANGPLEADIRIPDILVGCTIQKVVAKCTEVFDGTTPATGLVVKNVSDPDGANTEATVATLDVSALDTAPVVNASPTNVNIAAAGDAIRVEAAQSDNTVGKCEVIVYLEQY